MNFPQFDKFEINRQLSHRLCFTVYEARDRRSGKMVELKVLDSELSNDESNVINFLSSARIIKHLDHPNIFRVLDLGNDPKESHYYIAGEFNDLRPLRELILDTFSLSLEDLIEMFLVIGKTLRYAHLHGLVHGFLSPDSIFVKKDGTIKIDDFGFNWFIPNILQSNEDHALTLARYIPPEYYKNADNVDGRADIYSLGLILYELLQGKHPFGGNTVSAIQSQHLSSALEPVDLAALQLPTELDAIISTSVNKNRELRFQNLKECLKTFEDIKEKYVKELDVSPVKGDSISPAQETEQSEKHFDDVAFIEAASTSNNSQPEERHQSNSLLSRKFAFSGVGALFLVVLILFVTNYVPLPFLRSNADSTEHTPQVRAVAASPDNNSTPDEAVPATASEDLAKAPVAVEQKTPALSKNTSGVSHQPSVAPKSKGPELDIPTVARKTAPPPPAAKHTTMGKQNSDASKKIATKVKKSMPVTKPKTRSRDIVKTAPKPPPKATKVTTSTVEFYVKSNDRPLEANIFLDNSFIGKTDRRGKLEVNELDINRKFTVKVSKEGYASETRRLTVQQNTPTTIFDIKSKEAIFGTVLIDAVPIADKVYVDGELQDGATPSRISLKYGKHAIRLVNSALGLVHEQQVDLKIGQVLRVRHDFTQEELGKVAISLRNAAQYGFGYVYVDGEIWHEKHNTTPLQLKLAVGPHTIEVKRDGFSTIPRDVIVEIKKGETKYVSFTFNRNE